MSEIVNNNPYILNELVSLTVYVKGHLFILKVNDWNVDKKSINQFFRSLEARPLYMYFGKRTFEFIKLIARAFRPTNVVDHAQIAKLRDMSPSLSAVSQSLYDEEFCRRTLASPRETALTDLAKQHLIMRNRLLYNFAVPMLATDIWKNARENTAEILFKKGRGKKFLKTKWFPFFFSPTLDLSQYSLFW